MDRETLEDGSIIIVGSFFPAITLFSFGSTRLVGANMGAILTTPPRTTQPTSSFLRMDLQSRLHSSKTRFPPICTHWLGSFPQESYLFRPLGRRHYLIIEQRSKHLLTTCQTRFGRTQQAQVLPWCLLRQPTTGRLQSYFAEGPTSLLTSQ